MSNETKTKEQATDKDVSPAEVISRLQQLEQEKTDLQGSLSEDQIAAMFAFQNGCDIETAKQAIRIGQAKQNMAVLSMSARFRPRVSYRDIKYGMSNGIEMNNMRKLGF